jgi:hypothetical protein
VRYLLLLLLFSFPSFAEESGEVHLKYWVTHDTEKIAQEETRLLSGQITRSTIWNGEEVSLVAARGETVAFQIIFESNSSVEKISLSLKSLRRGEQGVEISSAPESSDLFDYRKRDIELFFVRYLEIKGLSEMGYDDYDERHLPPKFRRPFDSNGKGQGDFLKRPHANYHYPDILVPFEAVKDFPLEKGKSQAIWLDIFVPYKTLPGSYSGFIDITKGGQPFAKVPVSLKVLPPKLPKVPSADAIVHVGDGMVKRHLGYEAPNDDRQFEEVRKLRDKYFQLFVYPRECSERKA